MFAVAALVSFFQVPLNNWAQGTCGDDSIPHYQDESEYHDDTDYISYDYLNNTAIHTTMNDTCHANWPLWHIIQLCLIASTTYFAYWDYKERKRREEEKQGNQPLYYQHQHQEDEEKQEKLTEKRKMNIPKTGYGSIQG